MHAKGSRHVRGVQVDTVMAASVEGLGGRRALRSWLVAEEAELVRWWGLAREDSGVLGRTDRGCSDEGAAEVWVAGVRRGERRWRRLALAVTRWGSCAGIGRSGGRMRGRRRVALVVVLATLEKRPDVRGGCGRRGGGGCSDGRWLGNDGRRRMETRARRTLAVGGG